MKRLTVFIALSVILGAAKSASAITPEEFDKAMQAYLENDAKVEQIGKSLQRVYTKKQQEEAANAERAEKEEMENQFKNPAKVDIGQSPVKGPADAPVTIVEFSDFQCPYCTRGAQTMDELMKMYPKEVKLVFKNMPLPFHPEAKPAAKASLAAKEQGKFWEMYDLLFKNQDKLNEQSYIEFAKQLGLNVDKFTADLKSDKFDKMIEADAAQGQSLGIRGTPGFFVNGVKVSGARPPAYFKEIIDRWLKQGGK